MAFLPHVSPAEAPVIARSVGIALPEAFYAANAAARNRAVLAEDDDCIGAVPMTAMKMSSSVPLDLVGAPESSA